MTKCFLMLKYKPNQTVGDVEYKMFPYRLRLLNPPDDDEDETDSDRGIEEEVAPAVDREEFGGLVREPVIEFDIEVGTTVDDDETTFVPSLVPFGVGVRVNELDFAEETRLYTSNPTPSPTTPPVPSPPKYNSQQSRNDCVRVSVSE